MNVVTIAEAENGLAALIARVRAGESVLIVDRGVPVARLEPAVAVDDDARLARLERAGIIRRGTGKPVPLDDLAELPEGAGTEVLDALLEERREGR